ncbi:hypothetical protein THIOM_000564 [Candidatus Thiomargarita nelsonii]|uniref:Uncharacterized protein n=1 Tax=Candidatus Thiomargarita nelsonii TaxID=1003181 RepID=A0A176S6L1_9GAMM|nr:hypothetical protein THIOM_000564 [Candidatus Thiomargarita nelsonii]
MRHLAPLTLPLWTPKNIKIIKKNSAVAKCRHSPAYAASLEKKTWILYGKIIFWIVSETMKNPSPFLS